MKPTLLYYSILKYRQANLKLLRDNFELIELPDPSHDTPEILSRVEVLLAPLGYMVGPEKIEACPRLKAIGSNTTGHPHIDVAYAAQKGIGVVTLKGRNEFLSTITPTAELSFGLIIMLTRNVFAASRAALDGVWDRRPFGGKAMLSRMRLGVAGLGRLGSIVAKYGLAFGMQVAYCDPFVQSKDKNLGRMESLGELAAWSDVVSVHIPHEPETENIFDAAYFKTCKPGSYFVNTSRGELVDHAALLTALEDKTLAGAAMDVFENEFVPGFDITLSPLWRYARDPAHNVILTPHIGGSTEDAWSLTEEKTILELIKILK